MSKRQYNKTRYREINAHYSISNEFYKLVLGETMLYSCGYYRNKTDSLDQAAENKFDLVCKKLKLKKGEKYLDIACGWGGLLLHAVERYGVVGHGITLSVEQYRYVKELIERKGLSGRCSVELKDLFLLEDKEKYDKISCIGCFTHLKKKNLLKYITVVNRALKDRGLFLQEDITTDRHDRNRNHGTSYMSEVFPGYEAFPLEDLLLPTRVGGFEVLDVETQRMHYARTIREWASNMIKNEKKLHALVGEAVTRKWYLYIVGSALCFEEGYLNNPQVLCSKNQAIGPVDFPVRKI